MGILVIKRDQYSTIKYRFLVSGFPTIIYFSEGTMYKFKGTRILENIIEFAKGGYNDSEIEKERIPLPGENQSYWIYFQSPIVVCLCLLDGVIRVYNIYSLPDLLFFLFANKNRPR